MKQNASKLITGAILGFDGKSIVVAGKRYVIPPPTIARIAQAAYYLSDLGGGETIQDLLKTINDASKLTDALSCFIAGDTSLSRELANGTFDEAVEGLSVAYSMISAKSFMTLSALARSVALLTAKPK